MKRRCRPPKFYRMDGRPLTPWGDYGSILQHGMTAHMARAGGLLSLERTGPYMPPITFPGIDDVVLTSDCRALLEASGLGGFTFQPVNKTRIVELPWHEWDLTTDYPPEMPESGEPEDYILERPPNARLAQGLGDIWELVVPITAIVGRTRNIVDYFPERYIELNSWNGADFFRGVGYRATIVAESAKLWLQEHLGSYMEFQEFSSR